MKIDFSQKITLPNGIEPNETVGEICSAALNDIRHLKEPLKPEASLARGRLALRVMKGGEQDISPEDAALIRSLLSSVVAPVIGAVVYDLLEG